MKIRRALISVSNKEGIVALAEGLTARGIEILSTGGTARALRENGISVKDVSDFTGFPEMLDGRVKTLHPRIHGGLLALRNNADHMAQVKQQGLDLIDLVVVNLYPFEAVIKKLHCTFEEAVEQIDVGGPAMLRSAAKNFEHVTVLIDPSDYSKVLEELKEHDGGISYKTRLALAEKVFTHTARYDAIISGYLGRKTEDRGVVRFPSALTLSFDKVHDLRYGENPHQQGAFYRERGVTQSCISTSQQIHGKAMSFNNYLDANAALELIREFQGVTVVIVKHSNPCGVAIGSTPVEAFLKAKETDPVSAFGGVIAFNRSVDERAAHEIISMFLEIVIAPDFEADALELLRKKKDLRLLTVGPILKEKADGADMKRIVGGLLLQDYDEGSIRNIKTLKIATRRKPTDEEFESLAFAWVVCKHVKSNAIVYARNAQTIGIGAGQMSRVDSVRIGSMKAKFPLKGAVLSSDAFFPFRDGIDEAFKTGVTAIIQPGGSIRDEEVIRAADEHEMAMVFTGIRHFRH